MRFVPTSDLGLVRQIMTDPRIYRHICDDFSPGRAEFQPAADPRVEYVLVYADSEVLLGLFMFVAHSPILSEVHTCLLPSSWGPQAAAAARGVAAWKFAREPQLRRIITAVPEYNSLAARYARKAGMTEYGRNTDAHQKDGHTSDLILLGLTRPEEPATCPQQ